MPPSAGPPPRSAARTLVPEVDRRLAQRLGREQERAEFLELCRRLGERFTVLVGGRQRVGESGRRQLAIHLGGQCAELGGHLAGATHPGQSVQRPRGPEQVPHLLAHLDRHFEVLARRAHVAAGRPGPGAGLEQLHLVLHVRGQPQGVQLGQGLARLGGRTGQRQGVGGQRLTPAGRDRQPEVEEDSRRARRLQVRGLHPALFEPERTEGGRDDRASGEPGCADSSCCAAPNSSSASRRRPSPMRARAGSRTGSTVRTARSSPAHGGAAGRDQVAEGLVDATGVGQALSDDGVQAGARAVLRVGRAAPRPPRRAGTAQQAVEAETPSPELIAPHRIEIAFQQLPQRSDIGGAAPEERVIEAEEGHPDPLTGVSRLALQGRELERGLLVAAAEVRRLGGQQARFEALPGVDGGPAMRSASG